MRKAGWSRFPDGAKRDGDSMAMASGPTERIVEVLSEAVKSCQTFFHGLDAVKPSEYAYQEAILRKCIHSYVLGSRYCFKSPGRWSIGSNGTEVECFRLGVTELGIQRWEQDEI